METSLRLVLLVLGLLIVAGIVWDATRNKKRSRKSAAKRSERISEENTLLADELTKRAAEALEELPELEDLSELTDFVEPRLQFDEEIIRIQPEKEPVNPMQSTVKRASVPTDIMIMHIMARQSGIFLGTRVLEAFNDVNLYFGDRQIFHRYENIDGTGNKVFSVASAVEPGFFDLSRIESFATPGITLFFAVTQPNQSIAAFELMLRTAKQLAMRLEGELKDEQRRTLTAQTIEQLRARVRLPLAEVN